MKKNETKVIEEIKARIEVPSGLLDKSICSDNKKMNIFSFILAQVNLNYKLFKKN